MMEFTVGSPKIQETLYKRLIRSILEYGSRVRSPYQKTYNDAIESVKKKLWISCGLRIHLIYLYQRLFLRSVGAHGGPL